MKNTEKNDIVMPFLKWAGGKRWLVGQSKDIFPTFSGRYLEPFLGSGAVFFHLLPNQSILADANTELVETYQAIQKNWKEVLTHLKTHHRNHCSEYYYKIRSSKPRTLHTKAAKFIYLNRTCWNGLYRVNLSGEFNVPIGTKKNVILDTDRFDIISKTLNNSKILSTDFEMVIDQAGENDFIFIDPPYTVKHNLNGFIKYNEKLFSWSDQIRLKNSIDRAISRGAKALVTNANHSSVKELYHNYKQEKASRRNVIAAHSKDRGTFDELLIFCGYS